MTPDELRAARKRLGMTQAQLAHALQLEEGGRAVRRWELGERKISGPAQVAIKFMLKELRKQPDENVRTEGENL